MGEAELVLGVADRVLDREVGGDEPHLVAVALRDASDHVLDVAEEGSAPRDELAVAEPAAGEDLLRLIVPLDIQAEVAEIASERATRTGHGDDARLDLDLDAVFLDVKVRCVEDRPRHRTKGRPKPP